MLVAEPSSSQLPSGAAEAAQVLDLALAVALASRYAHTSTTADLAERINLCRTVVTDSSLPVMRRYAHCVLGEALRDRFEKHGRLNDIHDSVDNLRDAFHQEATSSDSKWWPKTQLGRSLARRFQRTVDLSDITEALPLQRQALQTCPTTSHYRHHVVFNLAHCLYVHYRGAGNFSTLREAITYHEEALSLRPDHHRDRHLSLNNLGIVYKTLYECSAEQTDLDIGIAHFEGALALRPEGSPDRDKYLNNLSTSIEQRYLLTGLEKNLDQAIKYGQEALDLRPLGHPLRHSSLTNLSIPLSYRALRKGSIEDLDRSIQLKREVLELITDGHYRRSVSLINLGNSLKTRFQALGQCADLDEAIDLFYESLALAPPGRHEHELALFELAETLQISYEETGALENLYEAINLHKHWFEDHARPHNKKAEFAHVAASNYQRLYDHTRDMDTLNKSIELFALSVRLYKEGQPSQHLAAHELASGLLARYNMHLDCDDAQFAYELQTRVLQNLPQDHPEQGKILCGVARLYLTDRTSYFDPLQAIQWLSVSLRDERRSARLRLNDALGVLSRFEQLPVETLQEPKLGELVLSVYRNAISLLPEVAFFGLDPRSRLSVLREADKLGATAALRALDIGETESAVEIFEEGCTVFWTQYLRLRSTFDHLPSHLHAEFDAVTQQLRVGQTLCGSTYGKSGSQLHSEAKGLNIRLLGQRLQALVSNARRVPGFERFMLPDTFDTLSLAASRGPVVVLLANRRSAQAIIFRGYSRGVEQMTLPDVNEDSLLELRRLLQEANKYGRGEHGLRGMRKVTSRVDHTQDITARLWHQVVQPILKLLNATVSANERLNYSINLVCVPSNVHDAIAGEYGFAQQGHLPTYLSIPLAFRRRIACKPVCQTSLLPLILPP